MTLRAWHEVVTRGGRALTLHHVVTPGPSDPRPVVLLVPGFIQNRHAFALPRRSLVDALAARGFEVVVVDLPGRRAALRAPRVERLSSYVDDVASIVERLADRHPRTALVGHSMGGLIGVSLPSDAAARLSCVAALGSPLLPGERVLRRLSLPVELASRVLSLAGAPFPGRRIAGGIFRARAAFGGHRVRLPMRVWSRDALTDDELSFSLEHAFTDDAFGAAADMLMLLRTKGERMGDVPIGERLAALRAPLLVIGGNDDGLAPEDAVRALYERAGSRERALVVVGEDKKGARVGHIDLLVGRHAPTWVWPPLLAFLDAHLVPNGSRSSQGNSR